MKIKQNIFKIFLCLLVLCSYTINAQSIGKLYLSSSGTGRIYDVTGVMNTPQTAPTEYTAAPFDVSRGASVSNLAVGFDTQNSTALAFWHSDITATSPVLKNNVSIGQNIPVQLTGLAVNNVPGTYFGQVYGISSGDKTLRRFYPSGTATSVAITGDADWNSATNPIFTNDSFYDYQNNIYTILQVGTSRYLYKVIYNGTTAVASKAVTTPISGPIGTVNATTNTSNTTSTSNIRGLAYLKGIVYGSAVNSTGQVNIYTLNIKTGASAFLYTYNVANISSGNLDMASVEYYVPFTFKCGTIGFSPATATTPFVAGTASTKMLRVYLDNIYETGNFTINVTGADINITAPSQPNNASVTSTAANTFVDIPIKYEGTGGSGYRTVTVDLNGSSTKCSVSIFIDADSDGDGILDSVDLDDDNDGILNTTEGKCTSSSNAVTDGFDNTLPAPVTVNGNNIRSTNPYNGWTAQVTSGAAAGTTPSNAFNVINVNGAGYDFGPDSAHSGSQYIDINGNGAVVYQDFSFATPTVVSASAFFANRATNDAGYAPWTTRIEIFNITTSQVVYSGDLISFDKSMGDENWLQSFVTNRSLPAGSYRIRMFVADYGHFDTISYCFSTDTDGDGIPDYLDLDSDNDGCFDAIEGAENVLVSQLTAAGRINTANTGGIGTTAGTNNGVPNLVNPGGAADNGNNTVGQAVGSAQNANVNSCFVYAQNDINGITLGQTARGNVLFNDNALDGTALTVVSATYTNSSGATAPLTLGTSTSIYSGTTLAGQMTLNIDGTYTFVAATGYSGTVPVTYTASNTSGNTASAILNIKVIAPGTGGNNAPVAQNDTAATVAGVNITSNALANDKDFDGNTLTITSASVGLGAAAQVSGVDANGVAVPLAGSININATTGSYTYIPATGFTGTINPITYTISDGLGGSSTATITIKVLPNNNTNLTFANDDFNISKGVVMSGNVLTNDTDPQVGQTRTVSITSVNVNGTSYTVSTASTQIPLVGTFAFVAATGEYTFTPVVGFVGTVNVPYTVCDNGTPPACDTATLFLASLRGYCYKPPYLPGGGATLPVVHGITALNRAGPDTSVWPGARQSAWTVLEAKTKGFAVNRLSIGQINAITNPVEGMMVYDTTNNCLKMYTSTNGGTSFAWYCMTTQACPD